MMLLVCAVFLALASILYRRFGVWTGLRRIIALSMFAVISLSALELGIGWVTGEGINDSVFYHLKSGLAGGDISQYAILIVAVLSGMFIAATISIVFAKKFLQSPHFGNTWAGIPVAICAVCAILAHPVSVASTQYALRFYLAEELVEGYRVPIPVSTESQNRQNLVIIYLESVERTYFDDQRFPGLTPSLADLESRSTTFTDVGQTIGAGFTIGGMVASQCGVPLVLSGGENSMRVNRFLSGATCLGDILSDRGYHVEYLGGASTEFAGKGAFYRTHGYDNVQGLDEIKPQLSDDAYLAEWGLQDDTLFGLARERLSVLSDSNEPFVLTLLTLDTHHPNGHADTNRACTDVKYLDGSNPMLNSVLCSDLLAADFIKDIAAGPAGKNTLIAVVSDHLAMGNSASDLLKQGPRRNLFLLHEPSVEEFKRIDRAATTLDVAPTLLGVLGIETGQMGFGVNLLGDEPTLPEKLGVDSDNRSAIDKYLLGFRSVFNRLWDFPDLSQGLYANIEKGEIQLGENAFRAPVLFAFDNEMAVSQAILGEKNAEATITEAILNFEPGQKYIWVDECRALRFLELEPKKHDKSGLCAAFGRRLEGTGLFNFERSGFLPTSTLEAWIAVGGDPNMAVLETDRIEAIGRRRGELPIVLPFSNLTQNQGRGVMLHSAAYGAGRSLIRRQTTDHLDAGEDMFLKRGINLIGIGADGRAQVINRLDNCAALKNASVSESWLDIIKTGHKKFQAHALVVHDTAFCGSALDSSEPVLIDLPLPELKASQMRQPYIGLIDRQGRVFEYVEREFSKLRVFLDPSAEGLVPHDSLVEVKLGAKTAPHKVALAMNSNAVTGDAVRIAFASEAVQKQALNPVVGETGDQLVRCRLPAIPDQPMTTTSRPLAVNSRVSMESAEKQSQISFGKGWWGTEPAGRWIGDDVAQLSLLLPAEPSGLGLRLEIVAYQSASKDIVLQYGQVDLRTLESSEDTRLSFDVSRLPRGEPVTLSINTGKQEAGCPALHRKSRDNRALRYMLKSIELVPAKHNPIGLSVAHGGGRLSGTAITNSFDALQKNRDRFEAFEIDFEWTEDGDLVCLHDWSQSFANRFGDESKPPLSLGEFRLRLAQTPESARNCDLEGLAGWMRANPNKLIVTDVKSKLLPAHELIAARHPDLLSQFVPQAQQPAEIGTLRSMGFTNVVWTLYRFGFDAEKVVEVAKLEQPDAITMPESFASKGLLNFVVTATGLPVLVHTVNDEASASCLMHQGAAGIYSDDLGSLEVLGLYSKNSACGLISTQ